MIIQTYILLIVLQQYCVLMHLREVTYAYDLFKYMYVYVGFRALMFEQKNNKTHLFPYGGVNAHPYIFLLPATLIYL